MHSIFSHSRNTAYGRRCAVVSLRKRDKEMYEIDYHVANFKLI